MGEPNTCANGMTKSQVMDIAMDMGRILLKSGAETSRVEDTMMRFCRSHGYYDLNVFCTPTVIILGDESAHGKAASSACGGGPSTWASLWTSTTCPTISNGGA